MVRAKRRPFQTIWLLLCANVCRYGIHRIVVQGVLLHGAFLPAGEDVGIRESIVQRPQPLQPCQCKRLRLGTVQRLLMLRIIRWSPPPRRAGADQKPLIADAGCGTARPPRVQRGKVRQNARQKTAGNLLYLRRSAAAGSLPAECFDLSPIPAVPLPCLPPGQRSRCRPARCAPCQSTPVRLPQSARALPAWFRWQDLYAAPFRCTLPAARAECLRQFQAVHAQEQLLPQAALFQNSGLPTRTRRFPAGHILRCAAALRLRQCRAASRSCAAPHPPAPAARWSGCRSPLAHTSPCSQTSTSPQVDKPCPQPLTPQ